MGGSEIDGHVATGVTDPTGDPGSDVLGVAIGMPALPAIRRAVLAAILFAEMGHFAKSILEERVRPAMV